MRSIFVQHYLINSNFSMDPNMPIFLAFFHGKISVLSSRQYCVCTFSGLVIPKMVVEEFGIVRTDVGCLGYGIYFSDSASTSLKYTTASTVRPGRRLLCICQVVLGESANYYSFSPTLIKPPVSFHSTHGVKRTEDTHSMFTVSGSILIVQS